MKKRKLLPLVFIFNLALASTAFSKSARLDTLQLPSQVLATPYGDHILFPRDYEVRFRGQEAELYSLDKALRGFFGDNSVFVESLQFSSVSLILQGKFFYRPDEDTAKMKKMRKYFCKNWRKGQYDHKSNYCYNLDRKKVSASQTLGEAIQEKLKKKKKYSERAANLITKELMDKQFNYESQSSLRNRLVDYNSDSYQDFPPDILFSTIFQQNAMIYGDSVLVLAPNDKRSIDLGYFNGISNSRWGKAADAGEYITPAYIQGKDIIGIHLRQRGDYPDKIRNGVRIKDYKVQKQYPISFAFYKYVHKGQTYVLIFDGKRGERETKCITPQKGHYYHCYWAKPSFTRLPDDFVLIGNQSLGNVTNYVPNLIGVLALEHEGKSISRPDKLIDKFKYFSNESLEKSLKNSVGIGEASPLETIKKFSLYKNKKKYKLKLFLTTK